MCTIDIPGHLLSGTHAFFFSSTTVPLGHSHPLTTQISGQAFRGSSMSLQDLVQLGCGAHSVLICPSIGHSVKVAIVYKNYSVNSKVINITFRVKFLPINNIEPLIISSYCDHTY